MCDSKTRRSNGTQWANGCVPIYQLTWLCWMAMKVQLQVQWLFLVAALPKYMCIIDTNIYCNHDTYTEIWLVYNGLNVTLLFHKVWSRGQFRSLMEIVIDFRISFLLVMNDPHNRERTLFWTCSLNITSSNKRSARVWTALIPVWAETRYEDNEKVF